MKNSNAEKSESNEYRKNKICLNPGHNFPSHLFVEPGQTVTHTCPGCGETSSVTGTLIF